MSIKENITQIQDKIESARAVSGGQKVTLVAVSKNHTAEEVKEAYACGIRNFGENRIQEALPKIEEAGIHGIWHLVGHLQSNKAAKAASVFDWVQSIDKISTAEKLAQHLRINQRSCRVLIEVNTSGESSKNGIHPDEVVTFAERLDLIDGITPCGLMTIGPLGGSESENRKSFSLLREKLEILNRSFSEYSELSMGMSGDFEQAIKEGATIVRVGTAIFGSRIY